MLYYEISFPLTIFKYIFVKMLLLMTFIYISLKTSNIPENKSQECLKEVIAQLHKDPIHNQLVI